VQDSPALSALAATVNVLSPHWVQPALVRVVQVVNVCAVVAHIARGVLIATFLEAQCAPPATIGRYAVHEPA
jgi:hypothetical protein